MAQENKDSKWEGKASAELRGITAEQLWPLLEDFCAIHKWDPNLDGEKCRHVEGAYGKPGLVRYIVLTEQSPSPTKWLYEKLLSMDPVQRSFSYEITENNLGFSSFVSNVKVIEIDGGCKIECSFTSDPVEGMTLEDFMATLESNLKNAAAEMKKGIQAPAN